MYSNNTPLVSICCPTYNHEEYITKALDGFLMQKVNFPVEIIVHDDASSDRTSNIIREYEKEHSNIIAIIQPENLMSKGLNPTIDYCLLKAKGKYVALCEGDDYWVDPLKLQKQVDFLEANDDYNICFHEVKVFSQNRNEFIENTITRKVKGTTDILDLSKGNFIHTPSVVFRNNFDIPKWFFKSPIGDWTLYMIIIKDKKIKKIDDVMSVYRMHGESIWSNKTQEKRNELTKIGLELVYNNLKIKNKEAKNIIKRRIGVREFLLKRVLKKILNKKRFFIYWNSK